MAGTMVASSSQVELRGDGRRVLDVAFGDPVHELRGFAEGAPQRAVDFEHLARVAGLRPVEGRPTGRRRLGMAERCHGKLAPVPIA
jgi:hypothetical protein